MDQLTEDLLKEESLEKTCHGGQPGQIRTHGVGKAVEFTELGLWSQTAWFQILVPPRPGSSL